LLRHHGLSKVTDTFAECGGVGQSLANFALYMFLVEGGVFFVHYWMLHVWEWGIKNLNHNDHHKYVHDDQMTSWSGYAFEAIDGTLQGVPFVVFQFVVPIPMAFSIAAGAVVGIWTLYIHVGVPGLPWPFMGADYHNVHHGMWSPPFLDLLFFIPFLAGFA
jgi:Delta7-sterol 5-desaturase